MIYIVSCKFSSIINEQSIYLTFHYNHTDFTARSLDTKIMSKLYLTTKNQKRNTRYFHDQESL